MKRLVLALAILASAAGVVGALHHAASQYQRVADDQTQVLMRETRLVAQARTRFTSITEQVRDLKQKLRTLRAIAAGSDPGALGIRAGSAHLSPAQSEQLLAELGFNWASTGDYLIVSKDTLRAISVSGLRGTRLNQTACDVLAITPDERANIETTTQALVDQYKAWAQEHIRREEPSGDIVAKYTLPQDSALSQSLSNSFASGITATLGQERGNLLLDYCSSWMMELGLGGGGGNSILTVKRYGSGDDSHLSLVLDYSGSHMSTDVSPYQEFPGAFLPLFPNGWPDLAQREGFALPKSFIKNP
jgi:hypothetical protein